MAAAGLALGAFWPSLPAGAAGITVDVTDYRFTPNRPVIDVGQSVTWKLVEGQHTITAEDGSFDVEKVAGETFVVTFDRPGSFAYYCEYDRGVGMTGVIKVKGPAEPAPAPAPATTAPPTNTSDKPKAAAAAPAAPPSTEPAEPSTTTSSFEPLSAAPEPATTTTAPAAEPAAPELSEAPPAEPPATPQPDEAAVTAILKDEKDSKDNTVLIAGIGVGVALASLGGWAWWHRSSRYMPA